MEATYPLARVFTDKTNNLNVFFDESPTANQFVQLRDIGKCVVEFCELDFSQCLEEIKKLNTETVSSNFEEIKNRFWYIVDLLKDKHPYVQFFLNSQMVLTFYGSDKSKEEQVDSIIHMFYYYVDLQNTYRIALEVCLSDEVLNEYTLPERLLLFGNNFPTFNRYMLRTRYGIAPMSYGEFDKSRVIRYSDPDEVDMKKVLADTHRDSQTPINMTNYFVIQTLEEMLYLEFMEMLKRGIRIKRCALCDKYFVLADKRKREYCDRVYKGNRTCKQIGAKLKFNKSVEGDQFLQEFQTIYNRMYSRYYRIDAWDSDRLTNKLSEEEFKQWSYLASQLRLAYKEGHITGKQMIEKLSKSTEYEKE
ncbi:DUF6076 domain-containing protein [Anaerotignum sp.]|uniref:DUF6076 domain-containing protein n=1 Tax=Anaerotignum sp. TaxID=2039241 RepID=UPI0028A9C921|nr:DUF6076 domain-containing protein [Anaerotignum sp.]